MKNGVLVLLRSVRQLLVAACVVPSSPIFVTLMNVAPGSSETSVLTRATRRNNPEDNILQINKPLYYKLQNAKWRNCEDGREKGQVVTLFNLWSCVA
jgi:hypothetical protein